MITAAAIAEVLRGDTPLPPGFDCALLRLALIADRRPSRPGRPGRPGRPAECDAGAVARVITEAVGDVAAAGTGDPEDDAVLDAIANSVCGPLRYVAGAHGLSIDEIKVAVAPLPITAAACDCGTGSTPKMVRAAETVGAAGAISSVSELMSPRALAALLAVLDRRVFAMTIVTLGEDRVSASVLAAAITAAVETGRIAPVEALALAISACITWNPTRPGCEAAALERFAAAVCNANSGAAHLSWSWAGGPRAPATLTLPPIII
jgi:hypothetical protein